MINKTTNKKVHRNFFSNMLYKCMHPVEILLGLLKSKIVHVFLLFIFLLPLALPVLSYAVVVNYFVWFIVGVVTLSFVQFIYEPIKKKAVAILEPELKVSFVPLLKLLLSPFSLLGYIVLFMTGFYFPKIFMLIVHYVITRIIYDVYLERDFIQWVFDGRRVKKEMISNEIKCGVCDESIWNNYYDKVPVEKNSDDIGFVCEDCQTKYSVYLTKPLNDLNEIKEHLAYCHSNFNQEFNADSIIKTVGWENNYVKKGVIKKSKDPIFYFDTKNDTFRIKSTYGMPSDIINLADVVECNFEMKQNNMKIDFITKEDYRDAANGVFEKNLNDAIVTAASPFIGDGEKKYKNEKYGKLTTLYIRSEDDYYVPTYEKAYDDFFITIKIKHAYFSTISLKLNTNPIFHNEDREVYDAYKSVGLELSKYLSTYLSTYLSEPASSL